MSNLSNRVNLIGNLGKDPEIKNFDGQGKLARLSLATSDSYTNKEGEKVTDTQWHNVVAWNGLAGIAEKYLKKGSKIAVGGRIATRSYEAENGDKRYMTEIVANELLMLDSKKES